MGRVNSRAQVEVIGNTILSLNLREGVVSKPRGGKISVPVKKLRIVVKVTPVF